MKTSVQHHYGWVTLKDGETPYEHVRRTHAFLTDDNHEWKDTGRSIVIYRNENSPDFHPLTPEWAKDSYWFASPYKVNN